MIDAVPAGEQHFFLDDVVVFVLGVDVIFGGLRDDDLVAKHSDSERRAETRFLREDFALSALPS